MSDLTLTLTRIFQGTWEGVVSCEDGSIPEQAPQIVVTHLDQPLAGVKQTANATHPGHWQLRVPIPAAALCDGVQTFLVRDTVSGQLVGSFAIAMGDALEADIRAEVNLLRAELDMLKRAFRRHCVETT